MAAITPSHFQIDKQGTRHVWRVKDILNQQKLFFSLPLNLNKLYYAAIVEHRKQDREIKLTAPLQCLSSPPVITKWLQMNPSFTHLEEENMAQKHAVIY